MGNQEGNTVRLTYYAFLTETEKGNQSGHKLLH